MKMIRRKIWPEFFKAVDTGEKPFELRNDDREGESFEVGDTLELEEWDPSAKECTGKVLRRVISYVLDIGSTQWGHSTVVLGLSSVYPTQPVQARCKMDPFFRAFMCPELGEPWPEEHGPGFDPTGEGSAYQGELAKAQECSVQLPEPWNEESSRRILALVDERDRYRELANRKTAEAEDNLVRAVLAERELANLKADLTKMIEDGA